MRVTTAPVRSSCRANGVAGPLRAVADGDDRPDAIAWEETARRPSTPSLVAHPAAFDKVAREVTVLSIDEVRTAPPLAGIHVLMVEDDQDSLSAMEVNLQHAGAVVIATATVREALEALARYTPDVILTDLKMPDGDGLSFVRELRGLCSVRSVPVLAVTGYQEFYDLRELLEAGFIGVMRKPINFPVLIDAVGALARARKASSKGQS
jgi:CheY-like chemotaxis protein